MLQFQPGAVLTARVTDPDADIVEDDTTWKWYRSSNEIDSAGGTGANGAMYIVTGDDVGRRIRVTATYSDGIGPEDSASLTSASPVQAASQTNDDPAFASTIVTRRIAENSTGNVGGPITAADANGDTLTYSIGGVDATLTDGASRFTIDPATGQLMVGDDAEIDYEDAVNIDDSYTVEVTAYDSSGAATAPVAMVTIHVTDVDEKPTFGDAADTNVTADMVVENAPAAELVIATYTATDPEEEEVTLSLMGDDAGLFELDAGVLSFKKSPDFEMPGDRNTDNVYEVTVRASDGTLNADRMVTVKVTNVDNEDGQVTLSSEEALVGVELTATLTDLEGGVSASGQITGQKWTWLTAVMHGLLKRMMTIPILLMQPHLPIHLDP